MKKMLMVLAGFCTPLVANVEIRIIEGQSIMPQLKAAKDIEAKLGKKKEQLTKELTAQAQTIETAAKQLQVKEKQLTPQALQNEREKLEGMQNSLKSKAEAAEKTLKRDLQTDLTELNKNVAEVVGQMAQKNGWDAVQLRESGEFIYVSPKINVSEQVVTALNENYDKKTKPTTAPMAPLKPATPAAGKPAAPAPKP